MASGNEDDRNAVAPTHEEVRGVCELNHGFAYFPSEAIAPNPIIAASLT
jgi:hypothetical protein